MSQFWGRRTRTRVFQLLEQFVVLSPELGPFGKLVLAACCVELPSHLEVIGLHLALLGCGFGRRDWEVVVCCPELKCRSVHVGKQVGFARTRLLMVEAPTALMILTAASMAKTSTRRDTIVWAEQIYQFGTL